MWYKSIRTMCKSVKGVDMIGPPCPKSHLRALQLAKPSNETKLQAQYRRARLDLHSWNQQFWSKHNTAFVKERDAYVAANETPDKTTLSADEMSVFYKTFLDKNWKNHFNYNIEWYKKNLSLLKLFIQVEVERVHINLKLQ